MTHSTDMPPPDKPPPDKPPPDKPRASDHPLGAAADIEPARVSAEPRERLGDMARLLPILGAFLLVSPLVGLFVERGALAGAPAIIWYVFGVWAALILAAALISRQVGRDARRRMIGRDTGDDIDHSGKNAS